MNKRKFIIGLAVCLIVCFSSIYIFIKKNNNIKDIQILVNKDYTQFNLKEIESVMNDLEKQTCNIEYMAENESVADKTFVNKTIELTDEYKYGKVFYSNNSFKDVTLIITGTDISMIIPAGEGIGTTWVKNQFESKKTYIVSISSDGSVNLNGKISIVKSNQEID